MFRRVPVTAYTTGTAVETFAVRALCGRSWSGMTNTPDLEINMRRALQHAEDCDACIDRWALLNTPGVIAAVVEPGS